MADSEKEFPLGYVDKRRQNKGQELGGAADSYAAGSGNMFKADSVAALRAQLTTFSATTYTATILNRMTKNDMVYALRQAYDSAGIK